MPDPSYKDPLLDLLAVDNGDEDNEENDYDILDFLTGEKDTDPLLDPDPDPNKEVSKSTYTVQPNTSSGSSGNYTSYNYFGKDRSITYESDLDEQKYTKTLDNGDTVELSLMDLSNPKKNPELNQYILDENEKFDDPNLFKPYQQQPDQLDGFDSWTTEGIVYPMIQPYEKELERNRAYLNELSRKGLLDKLPEEFRWDNSYEGGSLLRKNLQQTVPQEILEAYTRDQFKKGILSKGIADQWTDVLEDMPDGVRKANLIEREKRYENADAENYVDDQDKFMLDAQLFNSDAEVERVLTFEENVLDKDYKFENPNNEELVSLNGKLVPVSLYKEYEKNSINVKQRQIGLQQQYSDLVSRRDNIINAGLEMDLLKRDYSMLRKFGYVSMHGFGDLFVGAGEYLEAGGNIILDRFDGSTKEERGTTLISDYAQKRRKEKEKMMKTFSMDVEFDDAFDSFSNMGRFLTEETSRQLPIFAVIAGSGGTASALGVTTTLGRAGFSAATLGVMTAGQQIGDMNYQEQILLGMDIKKYGEDLEYNNKNWSDMEKFLIGSGYGLAEGGLGTMPTALLMSRGIKLVKEAGKKGIFDLNIKNLVKEGGLGIAGEMPTEGLTQLAQNGILIAAGDDQVDLFDNVDHATFSGGFFGFALGGGSVAMGMAMQKFMPNELNKDMEQRFNKLNDLKSQYIKLFNEGKRGDALKDIKEQLKVERDGINNQMIKFNERVKDVLGDKKVYQDFIDLSKTKSEIRAKARRIAKDPDIDPKVKQDLIDKLAIQYQQAEGILNQMLGENNPNRYLALKVKDPERYDRIQEKAKLNLNKQGIDITDKKLASEAYDLYLREEVNLDIKNTTKLIKELDLKDKVDYTFWNTENAAKQEAAQKLAKGNLTEAQEKFYTQILTARPGSLNGISVKGADGKFLLAGVVDTMVNNERTRTAMHELDHVIMWSALLDKNKSLDWKPMADAIQAYLKEHNPSLYNKMFVLGGSQSVALGADGKADPMETVINFMERIDEVDLNNNGQAGNLFSYWFGQETNKVLGKDINWKNTNDVVTFIKEIAAKIKSGEFTKQDLENLQKSKIIEKYSVDQKNIDKAANSESQAFDLVEQLWNKDTWNNLTEEQKIGVAQTAGLYLENYLKKRIGNIVSTEEGQDEKREIELLALVNKFTGLDTPIENIKESFSYKRGLINLIAGKPGKKSGFDPSKNDSMMAWVNTELGNRLLEVAQGSGKFGRFEKDIDAKSSDGAPAFQVASTDLSPDAMQMTSEEFNKTRQILEISETNPIYDKTLKVNTDAFLNLKDTKGKTKGKTVQELLTINPRRARTVMQEFAAKNLRADVTSIIGAQKSQKFKDFIRDEQKLQTLINLVAVKHRSSFPFFSNAEGTMSVEQAKANIRSDQGSFVSDVKAGNTIWTPIQMADMSKSEKANFINEVEKAFVDGLVTKKFAKDGTVEYNGRETVHKSLKDALANELMLDATFTAMKLSPDFNTRFEGNLSIIAENIKRDPNVAFSKSYTDAVYDGSVKKLADAVMKKGYDSVYDYKGNLKDDYKSFSNAAAEIVKSAHELAIIPDGKVARFMIEFKQSGIFPKSLKKSFAQALTSKRPLKERMKYAIQAEILAKELGGQVIEIMTPNNDIVLLGFFNRALDPASKKIANVKERKDIQAQNKIRKQEGKELLPLPKIVYEGTGDFYKFQNGLKQDLKSITSDIPLDKNGKPIIDLSKVRLMNTNIPKGLFARINTLLNNPELNAEQKREIYERDFLQEVKDANINNKLLFKYIVRKLVDSKMSDLSKLQLLQFQTSAAEGLRALTGLKYITFTDAPIGLLKGEHLADNAGSMMEIAKLLFESKKLTDQEINNRIDEIAEYHDQWLENRAILDKLVDAFDTNNPFKDLRILTTKPIGRLGNIFAFDLRPAETLIKQRENDIRVKQEISKSKKATGLLQMANSLSSPAKGISVFDFDDTLAKSNSKVGVTMPDGTTRKINATEFALESADLEAAGAKFDFSEFSKVVDGKKGPLADLALKRQNKFGSGDIFVLTARPQESAYAIHAFLKGIGLNIPIDNITGLEDGRPEAKADWIIEKVNQGYNNFYFADDAIKNIKAVKDALKDVDVKGRVELAFNKSELEIKINEIIEHQSGVSKDAKYSKIVAERRGMNKDKYTMFLPPSAEDFEGLLYYLAGKGEQGSKDLAWLQDNLFKPYLKGVDAINIAKTSIVTNYRNLNKQYRGVSNKLTTLMPDGNLTYDQGIRIYIWNKQGQEVPGISKRDLNGVIKEINKDPRLKEYADQIQIVGSNIDGVYAPAKDGWQIGSILGDLDNLSNKVGRKSFLQDWIETKDAVFTPDTFTKIEAIYGTRYVEALKDILWRMENGTNRPSGANRTTNAWLNWINNSVGTIMFFNRRSALLQGISFINFINWSDNNMLKAGLAYANQPQFWKDFAMIWNSPKLKQRRKGLKTDLQWQEIANAAKNSKDKFNAAVSWLLQVGFTPTQLMDNFAIAAGGAPFYRNRVKTYVKEGMTLKEAEAKAFDDFSEIAEKTQQSGDPALVSQEQASQLGRLVLAFQNVTQQMTRLMKKSGTMLVKRQRYPGQTQFQSDMTNVSKIIYYGAIQNFIFTFLQNAMFGLLPGFEGDEDDDYEKQMMKESEKRARQANNMIDTLLRGSGLKGAVISTLKNVIMQYQKQEKKGFRADHVYTLIELANISPPIGSKARKLYGAHQTKKFNPDLLKERGFEISADGRLNLAPSYEIIGNLASATLNLPLDRVVNEIESLVEATDNRNAAWQRIALALGWRTWDVGARNEEEDLLKMINKEYKKELKKLEKLEKKNKSKKSDADLLDLL